MALESKIKQAALDTAIRYLLKNRQKSPARTARNLVEFAGTLSRRELTASYKAELSESLAAYMTGVLPGLGAESLSDEVTLVEKWLADRLS